MQRVSTGSAVFFVIIGPLIAIAGGGSRWWMRQHAERLESGHQPSSAEELQRGKHQVMQYAGVPLGLGLFLVGLVNLI